MRAWHHRAARGAEDGRLHELFVDELDAIESQFFIRLISLW